MVSVAQTTPRLTRSWPQGRFVVLWASIWAVVGCGVALGCVLGAQVDFRPALRLSALFAEVVGFASLISARVVFPRLANLPYLLFLPLQILTSLSVTVFGSIAVALTQPLFVAARPTTVGLIVSVNAALAVAVGIGLYTYDSMRRQIEEQYRALREKEALEQQMRIARDVQQELLPRAAPQVAGLELCGRCVPARHVGGDYFDFLPVSDSRTWLVVADVSGKGVPAALLMAGLQASVRSLTLPAARPAALNERLNRILFRSSSASRYATFLLGFFDAQTGDFSFSNAGHHPPVRVRRGKAETLPSHGGLPIGMFEDSVYDEACVRLEPGDLLVLYTDGVVESPSPAGEEFGEQRLYRLLEGHDGRPLDEIADRVLSQLREWSGDTDAHDDATLVLARTP